jgi:peptidoglycan-associated lipoprotein
MIRPVKKVSFLKAHPGITIRIEGNCDERVTIEYNLSLGDRRAESARDYQASSGIAKTASPPSAVERRSLLIRGTMKRPGQRTGVIISS